MNASFDTVTVNGPTNFRGPKKDFVAPSTAAAGSTSADPGALPGGFNFYPTSGADDTKGVKLNSADNITGNKVTVGNGVSNKILKVYPPTGGTINGAAANAAISSVSGRGVTLTCVDSTANTGAGAFQTDN